MCFPMGKHKRGHDVFSQLLERHAPEISDILLSTVTGDESLFCHFSPKIQQQSME